MKAYRTLAGGGQAEHIDKRSRFVGAVSPARGDAEARAFIERVRAENGGAAHCVWAYLLREGDIMRWSDDGEPGGTAGQPTLGVLRGAGLTDICCATARYFGGVLLGSGGLVRAYSTAARLALSEAKTVLMSPWRLGVLRCGYAQHERLSRFLTDRGAKAENSVFGEDVTLTFTVPEGQEEELNLALADLTAGGCALRFGELVFRASALESENRGILESF